VVSGNNNRLAAALVVVVWLLSVAIAYLYLTRR
jgi:hypothetical protein